MSPAGSGSLCSTIPSSWGIVRAVAYSPDGARVAVGFEGRAVGVWDSDCNAVAFLRDQLVTRPYTSWGGPRPALVSTVAFASDSQILFAGAADGIVTIWDLATRQALFTAVAHTERTIALGSAVRRCAGLRMAAASGRLWPGRRPARCWRRKSAGSRPRSRPAAQLCLHAPIARCSAGI